MFKKNKTRLKKIFLLGALIGLILSVIFLKKEVFGRTPSNSLQGLLNTVEKNDPISKIFEGGGIKENFYKKALDANKQKSATKITKGLSKIEKNLKKDDLYKTKSFNQNDILNILYGQNKYIKNIVDSSCENEPCEITIEKINESYTKILGEQRNNDNKPILNEKINTAFSFYFTDQSNLENIEEAVIGDDIFLNGVESDGAYDIQLDIQNVGNLLFESFIPPLETVFYNMPPNYEPGSLTNNPTNNQNNNSDPINNSNPNEGPNSIDDPDSNNKSEILNLIKKLLNEEPNIIDNPTNSTNNPTENKTPIDTDPELKDFIKNNQQVQKANDPKSIQGNICIEGVSEGSIIPEEQEETPTQEELEEYILETQDEIERRTDINGPDNVQDIPVIAPSSDNGNDEGKPEIPSEIIDSLMDDTETQTCLEGCNIYEGVENYSKKLLCQAQCLCFAVSRPNYTDPELSDINQQLKLKFCMVPADSTAIPSGRSIFSLDSILGKIQGLMNNLINNGEMIAYQKPKEYLDNNVSSINRSKFFSFQINLKFKPIFSNKPKKAKEDKEQTEKQKIQEKAGLEQNPGLNPNKYLIIADPIKAKLFKENIPDQTEFYQKYNEIYQSVNANATKNQGAYISTQKKSENLNGIANFLYENLQFRDNVEDQLIKINSNIESLQNKL